MDYPQYTPQMAYAYGMAGGTLLTSTSDYTDLDEVTSAGQSPVVDNGYIGFIVGSAGATISAIDHGQYDKYVTTADGEDITDFPLVEGQAYFIPFEQITISAGALYLLKA